LYQTLGEQDSWLKPKLLAWKLELSRQSPLSSALKLCRNSCDDDRLQRRTALLLAVAFFVGTILNTWFRKYDLFSEQFETHFPTFGYREMVTSCLLVILAVYGFNPWSIINFGCHQSCAATWILLFFFSVNEDWVTNRFLTPETAQSYLRSIAAFVCLASSWYTCNQRSAEDRKSKTGKMKENRKVFKTKSATFFNASPIDEEDETMTQDLLSESSTSVSVSTTATTTTATKSKVIKSSPTRPPIRAPQFGSFLPNHEIHQGPEEELSSLRFGDQEEEEESASPVNPPCDISILHIDRAGSSCDGRSPPFEVRRYDAANTSGINFGFGGASNFGANSDRPILKPPRFVYEQPHRVAQSSWVAGGYWHQGNNSHQFGSTQHQGTLPDNLSRASSQTSGFFSVSNEPPANDLRFSSFGRHHEFASLPNSRVNSVCGDRHSVLSEPVYTSGVGQADISLRSLGNQLAFFDTTRKSSTTREAENLRKSRIVRDFDDDDSDSLNSSAGRLHQFSIFRPKAESSPIEKRETPAKSDESFLQKKIQISVSLNSLLLVASVTLNVGIIWYLVIS